VVSQSLNSSKFIPGELSISARADLSASALLDNGYHPEVITAAWQDLYPQIMTKSRFELAPKPTKAEKAALGKTGKVRFIFFFRFWGQTAGS
jgi:hypothetical protein